MKDPCVTSMAAVEVDGRAVGYIYLVEPPTSSPAPFWRYVESASGACYSHEDMIILLSLIKSSLRVARWHQIEVVASPGRQCPSGPDGQNVPWRR